jgi:DnaJ-domain-containing protein 1
VASAQANTKIERTVEAVESLTIAVIDAQRGNSSGSADESLRRFYNVQDARQELRDAFAEFLKPTLRVIKNDAA